MLRLVRGVVFAAALGLAREAGADDVDHEGYACDPSGYDATAMSVHDGSCVPSLALGGGYDPSAMQPVDSTASSPQEERDRSAGDQERVDEFLKQIWYAP